MFKLEYFLFIIKNIIRFVFLIHLVLLHILPLPQPLLYLDNLIKSFHP